MLRLMDRYPLKVPTKGGFEEFRSTMIIITSNEPIDNWYKFNGYRTEAIVGRLSVYCEMSVTESYSLINDLLI